MTYSPELMLKAARAADPNTEWFIHCEHRSDGDIYSVRSVFPEEDGFRIFNPLDPTKGDLAALEHALRKEGWFLWYGNNNFVATMNLGDSIEELSADTPADCAMRCVECMK